ncbi:hypothetical protein EX30DRAFT_300558 [Ascodesmis nigricans]|uniref:THO complex subunit 2 n=1 Tax=Ascodesmis nigricans TaxID=341454 RepID=A0A4S2N5Y3_9PEZI|nr:hypothetical protein EX30DRAFT_300558 [Ascodesmis nigricans]
MPNNQSRKRKQPASPSVTNPRPSPYQPGGNESNRRTSGGRGPNRRTSNQGTPTSNGPQAQRQNSSSRFSNTPTSSLMAFQATPSSAAASQVPAEDADIELHTPPPESKPELYIYEYLTDTILRDWQSVGAAGLRKRIDGIVANPDSIEKVIELGVCFQELIKSAISGRSPVGVISRFVEAVIQDYGGEQSQVATAFLEAITIFESDIVEPNLLSLLQQLRPRPFSEKTLGLVLEPSTLQALGFVTNMFSKKAVRVTTALVYKQRKHNLLREETEGFAKLITEFFTASYSSAPLEVVARTGERVKGLIGAFELDPGRVLDILLDTAACTVVSNARFFVRLLKGSAWWPQQLPTTPEDSSSTNAIFGKLASEGIGAFFEKLENPRGNKVAAQLLGFKFRYYQRPDVTEVTPENLLVLSALLIKIGFVDLTDLYPHLAPQDETEMGEILTAWKSKLDAKIRGGGKKNALMMAGALSDDTVPPPRPTRLTNGDVEKKATTAEPEAPKKEEEAPKPKKDDNQILVLLKYLLALGALPEALFILAKYPWLPGPCDDISEHLSRIIMHSIDTIYQPIKVPVPSMGAKKVAWVDSTGGLKTDDLPRRKPMVTFIVSNLKLKAGDIEYRFFWDEWKDGVPVCRSPTDVVILLKTLGRVLGVRIGRDPALMTKICQIGRSVLSKPDCTKEERDDWYEVVRSLLVPAVTLTDGNQGTVNEMWQLLAKFPTETRYMLYGEWVTIGKTHPELKAKVATVEKETRDLLKRISKTNVGQMARQLAKVATSNPVTVMSIVLSQVEGYDNLIEVVVGAARYFTPLGFDAIGYCVLKSMSDGNKQRVQADGMLTSRWLQSLSVFCGKIYTRYYKQMDPTPILDYVSRQLKQNNSVELIVLQQLVLSMSGINAESNFNDTQLQGLAGGELLRELVLKQFRDKRAEDSPETLKKLKDTLSSNYLAAELLVLIAQERQTCIYRPEEANAPLKVLAALYDEIHMMLGQYLDVMKMGFTTAELDNIIPDIIALCKTFRIEAPVAWWIARPIIRARMNQETTNPEVETDIEMKDAPNGISEEDPLPTPTAPSKKSPWNPVLERLMNEMVDLHHEDAWSRISPGFYTTFWQLDIYDIFVPLEAYQAEVSRIQNAVKHSHLDRSDQSKPGEEQRKAKREALLELDQRIQAELKTHIRENSLVRKRLTQEKEHWFPADVNYNNRDISEGIVNHCIFPRIVLSPNDASYCSRFIREVHKMGAPRFHTIGIYDAIFARGLHTVMFICTQREAENYGRFLKEILTDLHAWHADRNQYEREAHGNSKNLTGFTVKGVPFDWEDFRKILYKWHKALHMAIKNCLSSKEYMHIRNAIVVLKHVHEFFPAVDWIGKNVLEKLEEVLKTEKREDLKIAGKTLLGMLKRRESKWMLVSSFQKSEIPTPAQTPATLAAAQPPVNGQERPRTPMPAQQKDQNQSRPLSAVANEFIPVNQQQQQQQSARLVTPLNPAQNPVLAPSSSLSTSRARSGS